MAGHLLYWYIILIMIRYICKKNFMTVNRRHKFIQANTVIAEYCKCLLYGRYGSRAFDSNFFWWILIASIASYTLWYTTTKYRLYCYLGPYYAFVSSPLLVMRCWLYPKSFYSAILINFNNYLSFFNTVYIELIQTCISCYTLWDTEPKVTLQWKFDIFGLILMEFWRAFTHYEMLLRNLVNIAI